MINRMTRAAIAAALAMFIIGGTAAAADNRYEAALEAPDRFQGDRARDAARQPDKVLALLGVEPGMHVLDLYSGGGYYTELLSLLVGPEGRVTAHNNKPYLSFVGEEIDARYRGGRLGNVDSLVADNNELDLDSNRYDAITMILTYHDIYYVDPDNGWPALDGPKLLAELHDALKPGGALIVVDHYAAPGSPPETGNTTHRIDPAIVIAELDEAGFELTDRADFLRNEADDYSINVFDERVRGKTDRFVLRFEKRQPLN